MAIKNILISGAEVRDRYLGNRGAEHLLRTTASRLRSMGMQPCVTIGQVDPYLVSDLGLHLYVGNPRIDKIDGLVPAIRTKRLVNLKGLDGVLDASGFALGDAWGADTAKWVLRKYRQWENAGLPIVALPQAYGSFDDVELAKMCAKALSSCTLIFPRDEVSAVHVGKLQLTSEVASPVPDITIGESLPSPPKTRDNRLVIVPNWNLATRGNSGAYLNSLTESAKWGFSRGMEVVGVLHEGRKDLLLLQKLRAETGIGIVGDLTGWETKEYIAGSALVVSGRYHAVLAALTTGTPVLTHSWSHKYLEVLKQFGVADWIAAPDEPETVARKLNSLLEFDGYADLGSCRKSLKLSVDKMWETVEQAFLGVGKS